MSLSRNKGNNLMILKENFIMRSVYFRNINETFFMNENDLALFASDCLPTFIVVYFHLAYCFSYKALFSCDTRSNSTNINLRNVQTVFLKFWRSSLRSF